MPLVVLFLLPGGGFFVSSLGFWLLLFLTFLLVWMLLPAAPPPREETVLVRPLEPYADHLPSVVDSFIEPQVVREDHGVLVVRGALRQPADIAFTRLREALGERFIPLLREDPKFGAALVLVPQAEQAVLDRPIRPGVHWLLFGLTVLTTTWAGAAHQGVNLLVEPSRFGVGLPYSLGLLAILGLHELGHYFTALRHGMRVTPPYFIPVPFALGTFGAFIQMRSPPETRKALFDVAVAGPLAGLVVAVPALLIGLDSSIVRMAGPAGPAAAVGGILGGTSADSSLLMALLAKIALPEALQPGRVLELSPLGFAGWLGLLVTALNLLPIGQLDGGHIARAMFGSRVGGWISNVAMWTLILLAITKWHALIVWAIIIYFIAGRGAPPLNDITPINTTRRALGYVTFAILALILVPYRALLSAAGIHCPYL
ncbi:MAG: site-2 protease family protein [Pirellulales bacterium]